MYDQEGEVPDPQEEMYDQEGESLDGYTPYRVPASAPAYTQTESTTSGTSDELQNNVVHATTVSTSVQAKAAQISRSIQTGVSRTHSAT